MGLEQKREIPYAKAVTDWYDKVYLPVTAIIHDRGLLRDFPDRTETDLYLWIGRHRADLMEELGWEIDPATAVQDLADQHSTKPISRMARMTGRLWEAVQLDELEAGPPAGQWRRDRHIGATRDRTYPQGMAIRTYFESPLHADPWIESALDVKDRNGNPMPGYGWIFPAVEGVANVGVYLRRDGHPQRSPRGHLHGVGEHVVGAAVGDVEGGVGAVHRHPVADELVGHGARERARQGYVRERRPPTSHRRGAQ